MKPQLPAGDFSCWVRSLNDALGGECASDVPCDGCFACCMSSQFIHVEPQETETLAHIPPELLFPAPGLPAGHVLLGYDEAGHCPLLIDNKCSIYPHRPRTCRTYDCRVFAAAGLASDVDKVLVARQAERWQFSYPSEADRIQHEAVRAAVAFLREHAHQLPGGTGTPSPLQLALVALQIHGDFLGQDAQTGQPVVVDPGCDAVLGRLSKASR